MGKIRNWRKVSETSASLSWRNKVDGETLTARKTSPIDWEIFLQHGGSIRTFVRNKEEARAFAVQWMKQNPLTPVSAGVLPRIKYRGRDHFVDFRLEELRDVRTAQPIPFTELPGGVNAPIKKTLRGIRFRSFIGQRYMKGLDD